MGAVINPMGDNVQTCASYFLPVLRTGRGTNRRLVEGPCGILTSFGPSVIRLRQGFGGRHLPKASLLGGCV